MGRSWGGEDSHSSHHYLLTDQGKHSYVLKCLMGLNWIRWREEEALLMNNDLLVVKCSPSGGKAYSVAVGASILEKLGWREPVVCAGRKPT